MLKSVIECWLTCKNRNWIRFIRKCSFFRANECISALFGRRFTQMNMYILLMDSKRCNRDLKQRRPRRQQQRQKTIGFMSKTTALHVHHAFQYISLTSSAWLRRETSQCDVLRRTWTYYDKVSLLFWTWINPLRIHLQDSRLPVRVMLDIPSQYIRGTQRLFSKKYLFAEANYA